jgi:uncharacterized protein YceK
MKVLAALLVVSLCSGCSMVQTDAASADNQVALDASSFDANLSCKEWPSGYCFYTKTPPL